MFEDQAQTIPTTAAKIEVVLGEHDFNDENESKLGRKAVKVSQIIKHPDYDTSNFNRDIALLKLAEEVDLNTYTPACLPKTTDNYEGKNAWVYGKENIKYMSKNQKMFKGWGTTDFGAASSNRLLEVEVPVVSNVVCAAAMPEFTVWNTFY